MEFVLEKAVDEGEGVRSLYFRGSVPPYKPGNFFRLHLANSEGRKMFRPYSAASHPSEPLLRFCIKNHAGDFLAVEGAQASSTPIKKNGVFSSMVWELHVGGRAEIDGPYGIFTLDPGDSERVFIAGGVGITPLRSMIMQTLLEGRNATLFHSARTLAGITCGEELMKLAKENPRLKCFHAVTREQMPISWEGIRGRINAEEISRRLGALEGKTFYICGPPEMVQGVAQGLLAAGVPKEKVKKEEWG
ncbi:MAG: FAD-dependent oxidoreductase [Candidatus Micrarchaeota archaeon]|nr:FAD-dependent oxidoreductase [Candidatus Micrarchaeota archaeon]